ncbi:MAPEG family protein [Pseudomonas sp. F1_0610]|uniref:MAPEG family protein n=1 Tax=Pseudomonas sp. F1_0610 TaxID=3114284 RepID=UPI0039C1B199
MTTALWCVLIVFLMPYAGTLLAKILGKMPLKANHDPRAFLEQVQGIAKRAHNIQLNSFEIAPFFAAAVIIASYLAKVNPVLIDTLAVTFVISRVVYFMCYLLDWALVRSIIWTLGLLIIVSLFLVGI